MPEAGLIRFCEDNESVLMGMLRETIEEFADLEEYARRFGACVDRIGRPDGKYFFCLPSDGKPESFERRALEPLALHDPYYQYVIVSLPEGVNVRTGIVVPWFGLPGGARVVQFVWGNIPLTADECVDLGIFEAKGC